MRLSKERQGELFISSEAILWGLFPVITILSYNKLSPLVSLAVSSLLAALFFGILLSVRKKWHELKNTSALIDMLWITLFIGLLFYLLYFFGLKYTNAGNASIIGLTQILFSYLFFHAWRKDYLPKTHIAGAILMVLGAMIVLYPKMQNFTGGEFLILTAAAIATIGNFFQQRARKKVCSETIMFFRSLLSAVVILGIIYVFRINFSWGDINYSWLPLLINGIIILGFSKILWIEGIHRISVMKANALETLSPLFALFFAWLLLNNAPTPWQILSFIPMFLGVILLGAKRKEIIS